MNELADRCEVIAQLQTVESERVEWQRKAAAYRVESGFELTVESLPWCGDWA